MEYGCGTGPGACFLATRGFHVDAVDHIPRAISLARRVAAERNLRVHFAVQDICDLAEKEPTEFYDMLVDSYCTQSIVTDADRARLFAAVRTRLKPTNHYLIPTAMFDPRRLYDVEDLFNQQTGICYQAVQDIVVGDRDALLVGGTWYLPHRRHQRPNAIRDELGAAGFRVLRQSGALGGDLVCVRDDR